MSIIVHCVECDVTWDMDYDPPECETDDHEHELTVT